MQAIGTLEIASVSGSRLNPLRSSNGSLPMATSQGHCAKQANQGSFEYLAGFQVWIAVAPCLQRNKLFAETHARYPSTFMLEEPSKKHSMQVFCTQGNARCVPGSV